jgi:hypothetical protein
MAEEKEIKNIEDVKGIEILECKDIMITLDEILNKKDVYKDIGIDTKKFNFTPYNEHYYEENFKGFPKEWYKIMADSTQHEGKIINKLDSKINVKKEE